MGLTKSIDLLCKICLKLPGYHKPVGDCNIKTNKHLTIPYRFLCPSSPGIRGVVQTAAGIEATVPKSSHVHEERQASQVPWAVCTREGHQSGQPFAGAIWQVSTNSNKLCPGKFRFPHCSLRHCYNFGQKLQNSVGRQRGLTTISFNDIDKRRYGLRTIWPSNSQCQIRYS